MYVCLSALHPDIKPGLVEIRLDIMQWRYAVKVRMTRAEKVRERREEAGNEKPENGI
jgi:hypothetical protein